MFVVSRDTSASLAVPDAESELGDLFVDLTPLLHQAGDLLDRVDHGGVISTTELASDRRVGEVRQLSEDVHADLSGDHERPPTRWSAQLIDWKAKDLRRGVQDLLCSDSTRLARRDEVSEHRLCQLFGERLPCEIGIGTYPDQRAFELADVVLHDDRR
jgi:hypothetical protein